MQTFRLSIIRAISRRNKLQYISLLSNYKSHSKMLKKNFLPMYLEHLAFVIKRAGWKVTKIHAHLTFEQKRFKEKFILMNQKSRQLSKNKIEIFIS